MGRDRSQAMDHVVLVLFENRSLDNLLGHLYGPEDGKTFEGVIGRDLSNPIPDWAEHGVERETVPYAIGTDPGRADRPGPASLTGTDPHCLARHCGAVLPAAGPGNGRVTS
jgi:phospholipase C